MTEESAIRRLQSLAKDWPDTLWIWCADGTLYVMGKEDGEKVYKNKEMPNGGAVDPDHILARIKIPSDGGDW